MSHRISRLNKAIDWISSGYVCSPKPLAALRIGFGLFTLIWPRDITWIREMSVVAYSPPVGPFSLLSGPPPSQVIFGLGLLQATVAILVAIGWKTKTVSTLLSLTFIVASGFAYSYGKVDHLILFDIAPLMLGLAGWGSAWSVDARFANKKLRTDGFPMFLYGTMIAFAFFTAAAIKAATGWLEPGIEATRYYIVSDLLYSDPGPMASWILGINSPLLWKFLDYSTLFVEGCLILAVFFPGLFRIGLVLASVFHVGVFLTLGISFEMHAFVYLGFFLLPFAKWFPEIELLRDMKSRRRRAPTIAS